MFNFHRLSPMVAPITPLLAIVISLNAFADSPSPTCSEMLDELAAIMSVESATESEPDANAAIDAEKQSFLAARLYRQLMKLPTTQRYELLLAWTLPPDSDSPRGIVVPCKVDLPPKEFARALGERPRADSFVLPDNQLLDTHSLLLATASEAGRLQTLIRTLQSRSDDPSKQLAQLALEFRENVIAAESADDPQQEADEDSATDKSYWNDISENWTAREGHLQCRDDDFNYLQFRYPLTGNFRVDVEEVAAPDDSKASWVYRGRVFSSFFGFYQPSVNTRSLVVSDQGTTILLNGHPVLQLDGATTSPWLGLRSSNAPTVFRNLRMTGEARIPDEVALLIDDQRDGWKERGPNRDSESWLFQAGELRSADAVPGELERHVIYNRSLRQNESLTYEFFYEADKQIVHPTLGRVAFMLNPTGVDLHWVTDGESEWTGLAPDNRITEPLNRRGPKQIPLLSGDWNQVRLTRTDVGLRLDLNETTIYERALEGLHERRFGMFHNPQTEQVRVRHVSLTGDWPKSFPTSAFTQPVAESSDGEWSESILASNVRSVIQRAESLGLTDRFNYLARWVLPSDERPVFRMQAALTTQRERVDNPQRRTQPILSPVWMLVDTASELKRLDELASTVSAVTATDDESKIAREALLVLINLAAGQSDRVPAQLETLYRLTEGNTTGPLDRRWPELLVAVRAASVPGTRDVLRDWLSLLDPRAAQDDDSAIASHLQSLLGELRLPDESEFVDAVPIQLKHWIPTVRLNARRNAEGHSDARWAAVDGCVQSLPGYGESYLIFDQPLSGDYEVTLELARRTNTDAQAWVGGLQTIVQYWSNSVRTGTADLGFVESSFEPRLNLNGDWFRQRIVVRDGVRTFYANGRKLDEQPVPDGAFPWLALRNTWQNFGSVRDFRILGQPTIPTELQLLNPKLLGWRPYYSYSVRYPSPWSMNENGELVGAKSEYPRGSAQENLLFYQRPVVEDATLEYEFYYEPAQSMVYPALGLTTWIVSDDGLQRHEITDGSYATTELDPLNLTDVDDHAGVPQWTSASGDAKGLADVEQEAKTAAPKLKAAAWNRMRLELTGDVLRLILNGEPIGATKLDAGNLRLFGFFYYTDQTEAKVRNVVYRGDWPRELPSPSDQELANKTVFRLDEQAQQLASEFTRDFVREGMPDNIFKFGQMRQSVMKVDQGISMVVPGAAKWSQGDLQCVLQLTGDFDITADYRSFASAGGGSAMLVSQFTGTSNISVRAIRHNSSAKHFVVNAQSETRHDDGSQKHVDITKDFEANAGTLRLARRGNRVLVLCRGENDDSFKLIGEHTLPDGTNPVARLRLAATAHAGGSSAVTWTGVRIQAEKIHSPTDSGQGRIFVVNSDGTGLTQLTHEYKGLGTHGSPEFSPDGKLIVFDTYLRTAADSHILLMNTDGSDLRDLGNGCVPTFTHDGKQIVFSQTSVGMMKMDIDGRNRELISGSGWSIAVSSDGKYACFYDSERIGRGYVTNLTVLDLASSERRSLLENEQAERFRQIYWCFDWSPDSQEIAFVGINRLSGERELCIVSVLGSSHGFEVLREAETIHNDIAWHPDGQHLVLSLLSPNQGNQRLVVIDRKQPLITVPVPGIPPEHSARAAEWSTDGKRMVFSSVPTTEFKKNKP